MLRGGRRLKLVAVSARSRAKKRNIDLSGVRWEKDPLALATAPDIDVVVELIGGSGGTAARSASDRSRSSGGGIGGRGRDSSRSGCTPGLSIKICFSRSSNCKPT